MSVVYANHKEIPTDIYDEIEVCFVCWADVGVRDSDLGFAV